jgi:hypothetical protein
MDATTTMTSAERLVRANNREAIMAYVGLVHIRAIGVQTLPIAKRYASRAEIYKRGARALFDQSDRLDKSIHRACAAAASGASGASGAPDANLARLYRRRIVRSMHINAVLADAVLAVVLEAGEAGEAGPCIPAIPAIPTGSEKIPEKRYSFFETPEFRVQAYPYPYPSSGSGSASVGRIGRIGLIGLQLVCIGDTAVLGTTMEETVATHARA